MEFQIPLNKFEKEKKVIYLHKEGKTLKEIAIIVHMSFRDISRIIKVYDKKISLQQNKKEENNPLNQKIKKLSKNIKAYDLFRIGKTPVEVAIELNLFSKSSKALVGVLTFEQNDKTL